MTDHRDNATTDDDAVTRANQQISRRDEETLALRPDADDAVTRANRHISRAADEDSADTTTEAAILNPPD